MEGLFLGPNWDDMGYMEIERPGCLLPKVEGSVSSIYCSWAATFVVEIATRQVCTIIRPYDFIDGNGGNTVNTSNYL